MFDILLELSKVSVRYLEPEGAREENCSTKSYMEIRELKSFDATSYRELRVQALAEWPPGFGSLVGEEKEKAMEETESFLTGTTDRKLFGAFAGSMLTGTVRYSRYSGSNEGHRAYIAGLYVDPGHRRKGAGRALLEKAIDESKKDQTIRRINLTVVSDQSMAIRLYQSLGFVECGIDYEAFSARGLFFDEILMTKQIERSTGNS
ncbi:MAG: GNAT family N-acetyltransferase [Verrucomicrobiales bacterium]|nr:GNAT family N-acetyltransferase [Verrucomicrobiales bacterium]